MSDEVHEVRDVEDLLRHLNRLWLSGNIDMSSRVTVNWTGGFNLVVDTLHGTVNLETY